MKKIVSILFVSLFMLTLSIPTFAAEATTPSTPDTTTLSSGEDDYGVMPIADVLVWYYKSDGVDLYMRQWNETRGYWVSPEWIKISA